MSTVFPARIAPHGSTPVDACSVAPDCARIEIRSAPPMMTAPYRFIAVPMALPRGVHPDRSAFALRRTRCPIFGAPASELFPSDRVAGHVYATFAVS